MKKIICFLILSIILVIYLHEFPYLDFLLICFIFSSMTQITEEIIREYKLAKIFPVKNTLANHYWRLLFCLGTFLIFCIFKWTGLL